MIVLFISSSLGDLLNPWARIRQMHQQKVLMIVLAMLQGPRGHSHRSAWLEPALLHTATRD